MIDSVRLAELVIFAIFVLPALYCLTRHGKAGILGWLFLFVFCVVRIVAGALAVANPTGEVALIVGNVALSPLFLATLGITHEARILRNPNLNSKIERIINLALHVLIIAGIALLATGLSNLYTPGTNVGQDLRNMRIGLGLLVAAWALITLYCASSFAIKYQGFGTERKSLILLSATTFALAWIGVRVIYTLTAFVTENVRINPITGELVYRVVLTLVPEVLAAIALIIAGIVTAPTTQARTHVDDEEHRLTQVTHGVK